MKALWFAVCLLIAESAAAGDTIGQKAIGYPSPEDALRALRARPDVTFRTQDKWLIAEDRANQTVWLFVLLGQPAYPTAVKRFVAERNGKFFIDTAILCGSTTAACDRLAEEFGNITDNARKAPRASR